MRWYRMIESSKRRNWSSVIAVSLFCLLALGLRFLLIPFTNYDTDGYVRWYDFIVQHGRFKSLGMNFAIYTPPYLYLLSLATFTQSFLPKIVAIKLIPVLFDLVNAILVYKIVRLKHPTGNIPFGASVAFLFAPTIWINSAFWGQIDSLYTCFLLLSLYFILREKSYPAMFAFGVSASIKAQAAFLIPFLVVMALKKRIPWRSFLIIPIVYLGMMLPAVLAGRSLPDVFTIYLNQANELQIPSFNAPNWYVFVPQSTYRISMPIGFAVAIAVGILWVVVTARRKFSFEPGRLVYLSLVSVALVPFLLPKMHDRYFYPADAFSLLTAFYWPNLWFVAAAYQVISSLAYSIFLFDANRQIALVLATQLNTFILVYLLWKQGKITRETAQSDPPNVPNRGLDQSDD